MALFQSLSLNTYIIEKIWNKADIMDDNSF